VVWASALEAEATTVETELLKKKVAGHEVVAGSDRGN
jgi:hypothetical protein